ncbi:DUF4880 domain-containing protein [Pseudomonas sp. LP_7_YM]|uniref:DUF4880 domain-containing protein n=1 Tax=Pseudomonas sp. LP_7_YM TaxID=2485137 RepID=UPI00105E4FD9|nr:DUF4880 domain-containing protein [Pseudomonas sp. LP_7_YM]TDV72699.1 sigma-70-like protein [Pseudomonas sp. LP_7_YM]
MTYHLSSIFSLPKAHPESPVSQQTDAYRRRIQKLPRRIQQVFLLSRLDQLPYTAIARLLELDIDAVERKMVRLLEQCCDPSDASSQVQSRAMRWYVHLQSPQATASQRIEFRHWLDADASHLAAFEEAEHLWRRLLAPATLMGASGWHRRKRRGYLGWLMLTAFLCSLLVTAEAFT